MPAKQKVAIVGVSSYVAGPLARLLHSKDYEVVGIARPSSQCGHVERFLHSLVRGDLADAEFVRQATCGSGTIINMVCQLSPAPPSTKESLLSDQPPLDSCLYAASRNNCLLIHTSGNFGLPTAGKTGAITVDLCRPPELNCGYVENWETFGLTDISEHDPRYTIGQSKHRQDQFLQMYLQVHPTVRVCTLVLCATYGPGLEGKTSFWDLIFPAYLSGLFSDMKTGFIHVEDVAACYEAIIQKGTSGARYLAAGQAMLASEFFAAYARAAGIHLPSGVHKLTDPGYYYDDNLTRERLGIEWQNTVEGALPEHITYLKAHGKV